MRTFEDPRWRDRLAASERYAAPHLLALGVLAEAPGFTPTSHAPAVPDPASIEALARIPDDELADVRLALLRRIAESDLGTARSMHGALRARLATRRSLGARDLELELALCHFSMDLGFGVSLSWFRVGLLDPVLDDLELLDIDGDMPELLLAVDHAIDLLANETMALEAASTDRRLRLLLFRQRTEGGALPARAFDPADDFGAAMRSLVETDAGLAHSLGHLLPIAVGATSPLPDGRQQAAIGAIHDDLDAAAPLRGALVRCVHRLLDAPLTPRGPGFVTVRQSNQRLARAALWLIPPLLPDTATALLGDVGVRLGTSGKRDNQARDSALANTCAALLGTLGDDAAVASLARMLARIRNRPVRKQVEKALAAVAAQRGLTVDGIVAGSLPTFGLDARGRRTLPVGSWVAEIELDDGHPRLGWLSPDGEHHGAVPRALRDASPGSVAEVEQLVDEIRSTLIDERSRLEGYLAESRDWASAVWMRRFVEHPLAGVLGRRLIWRAATPDGVRDFLALYPDPVDAQGRTLSAPMDAALELWHPVEAPADEVEAWRDLLVERRIEQPIKQAFRETYARNPEPDLVHETRFADRPLAYGQFRALAGGRGWTAPMLGPFDEGERSVAYRDFPRAGLRAEFDHTPAGTGDPREQVRYVRSGSLRFTASSGDGRRPVLLVDVPARVFSEAMRDVDLFTSVPDLLRLPTPSREAEGSPKVAVRAAALRRLLPSLSVAGLSIVGPWLRVERGSHVWLISMADGETLRLPEEEHVEVPIEAGILDVGYLPIDDDVMRKVVASALVLARG